MEPFLNQDVATEVLSRLPPESLLAFKCTSKRWNDFISDPSFLRFHGQKLNTISGLFVQEQITCAERDFELLNYIFLDKEPCRVQDTVLGFLPEKVVLLASCNGLLCCRSFIHKPVRKDATSIFEDIPKRNKKLRRKELVLYICNPATKQWVALRPEGCHVGETFGLGFYPFGLSSASGPSFKVVGIRQSKTEPTSYSFAIYSSETETWRTSREVCKFNSEFFPHKEIFVNGRFHWLTKNHHIITFDAEQELSQVIKLPGVERSHDSQKGQCLGGSEGYVHYVATSQCELKVWMLKDYDEPEWLLKFCLPLHEFCQYQDLFNPSCLRIYYGQQYPEDYSHQMLTPYAFYNEVLFFSSGRYVCSYNFRSNTIVKYCSRRQLGRCFHVSPTVIPYSVSLASLLNFKGGCVEQNGHTVRNSRRRTRRKPKMFRRVGRKQDLSMKSVLVTKGCEAPDYIEHDLVTPERDMYAFVVVLLEKKLSS